MRASYSIDQFLEDFPEFKPKTKKNKSIIIHTRYDCYSSFDAVPNAYSVDGRVFESIEEMFIYIELTYGKDVDIYVDAEPAVADKIIEVWYSNIK